MPLRRLFDRFRRALTRLDHGADDALAGARGDPAAVDDPVATLLRLGALLDPGSGGPRSGDGEETRVSDAFAADWRERVRSVRERDAPRTDVARAFGLAPADVSVTGQGDVFEARVDGRVVGRWPSRGAVLADAAAAAALAGRTADWSGFDAAERRALLRRLRRTADRCPLCDGPVARQSGEHADDARRQGRPPGTVCTDCGVCEGCGACLFDPECAVSPQFSVSP